MTTALGFLLPGLLSCLLRHKSLGQTSGCPPANLGFPPLRSALFPSGHLPTGFLNHLAWHTGFHCFLFQFSWKHMLLQRERSGNNYLVQTFHITDEETEAQERKVTPPALNNPSKLNWFLILSPSLISEQESGTILTRLQGDEMGTMGLAMSEAGSEETPPHSAAQAGVLGMGWRGKESLKDVPKENISGAWWLVGMLETKRRRSQIHILLSGTEPGLALTLQQERQPGPWHGRASWTTWRMRQSKKTREQENIQGGGGGRNGWRDQKVQTSSYKMSKSWGCKYSVVIVANSTVLHILKLLRE